MQTSPYKLILSDWVSFYSWNLKKKLFWKICGTCNSKITFTKVILKTKKRKEGERHIRRRIENVRKKKTRSRIYYMNFKNNVSKNLFNNAFRVFWKFYYKNLVVLNVLFLKFKKKKKLFWEIYGICNLKITFTEDSF